jgi:hypothetical protein
MKNKNRTQIPAEPVPLTDVQARLRHLRATDPSLANPEPLPPATPARKVSIVKRTFGNYPELRTPQPQIGGAETAPPAQPEGIRMQHVAEGLGHLIVKEPQSRNEARKAEILAQAAADAARMRFDNPYAVQLPPSPDGTPGQPHNPYGFPTQEPH